MGSSVNLISDYQKEQNLLNQIVRRKVEIKVFAKENSPIKAEFKLNNKSYSVEGEICVMAKSQPLTNEDLKINFNKSELFDAELVCDIENVFLTKKSSLVIPY